MSASCIPIRANAMTPPIQGKSRMRETRSYGSVRGVRGDSHPYRDSSHASPRRHQHTAAAPCRGNPPPFADTHSSRLRPSNNTMASDGGALFAAPGVTTFGTGDQTSVSSGRGFV